MPVGFILRSKFPDFIYSDVIALGIASWIVAILSLWAVKIVEKTRDRAIPALQSFYHAITAPGTDQAWSPHELRMQCDFLLSLPKEMFLYVDPESYLGAQIKLILKASVYNKLSSLAKKSFPEADHLLDRASKAFEEGTVMIELVSMCYLRREDETMRAISWGDHGVVRVFVGCEAKGISEQQVALPDIYK